jgi:hypothetical protein
MSRGILIAGNESALLNALELEAAKKVDYYTFAAIPNRFTGDDAKSPVYFAGSSARIPLEWNPGSPISARTLILATENHLERINEAILVCDPPLINRSSANINFTDVEVMTNDHIKSWFFLIKELSTLFKTQEEGTLTLVYPDNNRVAGKDNTADLLGSSALAVFRSITRNLLAAAFSEPYFTLGFTVSEAGGDEDFAAFIFKQMEEKNRKGNGKLHKFGKLSFFK